MEASGTGVVLIGRKGRTFVVAESDAEPPNPLRLDLQLCFALSSASNLMTRTYRPFLEPLGLTYLRSCIALLALWERAPQPWASCVKTGARLGTLTPLFKRMEAAGLVMRTRDPADERRVIVDLTDKARTRARGRCGGARRGVLPAAHAAQRGGDAQGDGRAADRRSASRRGAALIPAYHW